MNDKKKRLDSLLVELGFTQSRERAQALILSGSVLVNDLPADKAGFKIDINSNIRTTKKDIPYVSRGGVKLEGALSGFNIIVDEKIGMDVGASTGGFTDCLLQRGAKKIYALDVGYGQLDWKLRNDPRVVVIERKNIRLIKQNDIPEKIDFAVIDVSFISLKIVLPPLLPLLKESGKILALIKPQFEVGKGEVGKGGVVRDESKHAEVIKTISCFAEDTGLAILGVAPSKLLGPKGNIEFFIYLGLGKK